ncbi:MAG: phenylalanine-4-hydroxylase [Chitinophagaceae bacterium]|nr:phenylalanine-4-hydroxylase [Chitinophagaceae bacterium]
MLVQQHEQYSDTDHRVWSVLYTRQLQKIEEVAYEHFKKGAAGLGFNDNTIPDFTIINEKLLPLTGWQIYAVPGLIPNNIFFTLMKEKQFGATTWIRKPEELDYLEEPDMFHDVFGHIPLLTDPLICNYLYRLAAIAVKYIDNAEVIESIARLYWYTIEFGLVKENRELKIYGAGILSSTGETAYCLSGKAILVPFRVQEILDTPYIKDTYQSKYFVLESMEQLDDAVNIFEWLMEINHNKN